MRSLFVDKDKFKHSVHGGRQCVDCHTNITQVPHAPVQIKVELRQLPREACGQPLRRKARRKQFATLGFVVTRKSTSS